MNRWELKAVSWDHLISYSYILFQRPSLQAGLGPRVHLATFSAVYPGLPTVSWDSVPFRFLSLYLVLRIWLCLDLKDTATPTGGQPAPRKEGPHTGDRRAERARLTIAGRERRKEACGLLHGHTFSPITFPIYKYIKPPFSIRWHIGVYWKNHKK